MRAKEANPSLMVELIMNELCEDCPLRPEFDNGKVFASLDTRMAPVSAAVFSISDNENLAWYIAHGTVRRENITGAFNNCKRPVKNGSIDPQNLSCGALIKLQGRRSD